MPYLNGWQQKNERKLTSRMETVQESSGRLLFAKKQEIIEAELRGATQNGICIKNREKKRLEP